MKVSHLFSTVLMLALTAAPLCHAEEAVSVYNDDIEESIQVKLATSPALEEWRTFLLNAWEKTKAEGELDEERLADLRKRIDTVLDNLTKLYEARLIFGLTSIHLAYYDQTGDDEHSQKMADNWVALLEKCVLWDLDALRQASLWCGDIRIIGTPLSELEINYTREMRSFASLSRGYTDEECRVGSELYWQMEKQVSAFRDRIGQYYTEGIEPEVFTDHRDFLTRYPYSTMVCHNEADLRKLEKQLFDEAEACWPAYKEAVLELVCPAPVFWGSGEGPASVRLECMLLDNAEVYLSGIVRGMDNLVPELRTDTSNAPHPSVESFAFGEIFTDNISLFRGDEPEDNEWFVQFLDPWGDGDVLPIAPGEVLDELLKAYPDGVSGIRVKGYQDIEVSGKPYELTKESPDKPEGAYSTRTIFRIISFESKETPGE